MPVNEAFCIIEGIPLAASRAMAGMDLAGESLSDLATLDPEAFPEGPEAKIVEPMDVHVEGEDANCLVNGCMWVLGKRSPYSYGVALTGPLQEAPSR